jgi:hypothetical protein
LTPSSSTASKAFSPSGDARRHRLQANRRGERSGHHGLHILPFSKVQAFSLETAGTFELDAELKLWFSGLGKVKFEFNGNSAVAYLNKLIAHHVL